MSFQAGVVQFDGRPITEWERAAILRGLDDPNCAIPTFCQDPGVFLGFAASRFEKPGTDGTFRFSNPFLESAGLYRTIAHAITFDGRLDNREDLLVSLDDSFETHSDAALALAAYELWGLEGLVRLVGDWSLAIWDESRRAVVLASDFAGVRPLYYSICGNRAYWSTRLETLVEWAQAGELDDEYVGALLLFGGCPRRTPYRGIFSVPPGHSVVLSNGEATIQAFWEPPVDEVVRYKRESDYEDHLRALFRESVRCRLRANAPVLCELSGGLDSSSVVCMASHLVRSGEAHASPLMTLSFEHHGSIDERFYKVVEDWCDVEGIHLSTATYPYLTEDRTGDTAPAFWDSLLCRTATLAAENGITTYMTGKLGDLIMGNWWDDSAQVAGLFCDCEFASAFQQALGWSKVLRIPIYWVLWRACLASLPHSRSQVRAHELSDGAYPAKSAEDSIAPSFRRRAGLSERRKFFSQTWTRARPERKKHVRTLIEELELRKLQCPEQLAHVHYVHPFAHRPLVSYMLSIPADIVCRPGEPRRLMRRAFSGLWPSELRKRRSKDSFGGVFLNALRPLVKMLLESSEPLQVVDRGYVDPVNLRDRLHRLTHSLECNEPQLRQIILLEYWLRGRENRLNPSIHFKAAMTP